jgi:glycosyltransferase involved in cell wall biosynthesis
MTQHILLYTDNPPEGGVQQYNHSILCGLVGAGYTVTSVQMKQSNLLVSQQKELGIKQLWLNFNLTTDFARVLKDIQQPKQFFSTSKPDLIIFSDGWPLASFAAKQAAIDLGIPYITVLGVVEPFPRDFTFGDGVPYIDVMSYHYTQAKAVVAVSQNNLDILHEIFQFPAETGQVIHYGRPPQYFETPVLSVRQKLRQEWEIPLDAVVCFTAARLSTIKGYEYQIEAIKLLKETPIWNQIYFVWAGTGEEDYYNCEPELKKSVEELGVTDRVKFLGRRWDIPDLLGASDIFILPSKVEGMPLCIMEAMAKGLIVIASAVSGIPEELDNTGKLLPDPNISPEKTVKELANTLLDLVPNKERFNEMRQACQQRATKMFTEERMVGDYIRVIKQALLTPVVTKNVSEEIRILENRVHYSSLVWDAWCSYRKGNSREMALYLEKSLKYQPFLPTEMVLNWLESFANFSRGKGEYFDPESLTNLSEWELLLSRICLGV